MTHSFTHDDLVKAAPRVLDRLRAMAQLPEHGTVAGQAVASMFFEELGHPVKGPVNDIDVFVNLSMSRTMRGLEALPPDHESPAPRRVLATSSHHGDVSLEFDRYRHIKFIAQRTEINIMRTYQVGLVNYTLISSTLTPHGSISHDARVSQGIVDGFDLNVVGVGINLTTGEVVSSPGFLQFLNTCDIQVETCNTPSHTLIRLAKKFHGNEIPGATCNYSTERAMLETAIRCQQRTKEGDESNMQAVLRFGSGKFKQLHEQFADHLPPIQGKLEALPDGRQYVFNHLVLDGPVSEHDQWLFEHIAGPTALPQCIAQTIYASHFPQIYSLFHPERCNLDPVDRDCRRDSLLSMDPDQRDGFNLHRLRAALGRQTVEISVPGMDEDDAAMFFFNQECAKSQDHARQAVAALEALSRIEVQVMLRLDQKADRFLEMHEDRVGTWKSLLQDKGYRVMEELLNCPEEDEQGTANQAQILELIGWIEEMGDGGQHLLRAMLPVHLAMGCSVHVFSNLVSSFPREEGRRVADHVMSRVVPSWPSLEGEPSSVRVNAIMAMARANQVLPSAVFHALTDHEVDLCLNAACSAYQYSYGQNEHYAMQMDQLLDHLLPRVSASQWASSDGMLIRALLTVGAPHRLENRLREIPDESVTAALENIATGLRSGMFKKEDFLDMGEMTNTWNSFPDRGATLALVEGMILSRSTAPQVPTSPRRLRF